jgi:beta-lactamase class C
MKSLPKALRTAIVFSIYLTIAVSRAVDDARDRIESVVGAAIRPVMTKYGIAGIAVGVAVAGKSSVYNYGAASTETRQPVTRDTLFEIGSITKTFTATLASYAQVLGYLSLSDKTSKYLPYLQNSKFGEVTLLNLGTHTPGGLPLQVPDRIGNNDQLLQYFKDWQPMYEPGTYQLIPIPGSAHSGGSRRRAWDRILLGWWNSACFLRSA